MKSIVIKKNHSRRQFISNIISAGIIVNIPFISSCNYDKEDSFLNKRQKSIVDFTQNFLWPNSNSIPSVNDFKGYKYLIWVLADNYVDPEENQYLLNGIRWTDETAIEEYNLHFEKLNTEQKNRLLEKVLKTEWGESWLSKMLTLLFEAMFADPIYGSNPNGIVWECINHNPGQPRPTNQNKYQKLLKKKKENIIITKI